MAARGASGSAPGPGEEDALYPIAVLIDELKSEDSAARVKATQQLKVIAEALGFARTREELIPFITEAGGGWDDEDEVLITVAEQFGDFLDYVGGPEHAITLLQPLEQLAAMEEATVRDKAVTAIQSVAQMLPDAQLERQYTPMLMRMAKHDWATSRASAALLLPGLRQRTPGLDVRELWEQLCSDEQPIVKRAAATASPQMAKALREPGAVRQVALAQFAQLAKDEQDGVRLLCIEKTVEMSACIAPELISKYLQPLVRDGVQDASWRVRYMLTDKFAEIAQAVGLPSREVVSLYERLAKDTEAEVRAAAAHQIGKLAASCGGDAMRLMQAAQKLCGDEMQQVRAAAAGNIVSLSKSLGPHDTMSTLLPQLCELLRDDNSEVRLNVIAELGKVSDVVGFDELSRHLLPAVINLASDSKWRVREAVIKEVPALAKQMGPDAFEKKDLMRILIEWLCDQVCEIRKLSVTVACELVKDFGDEWFRLRLWPRMQALAQKVNYMHRFALLAFLEQVAPVVSRTTIQQTLFPVFQQMCRDKVPNVRFSVAKAIRAAVARLDAPAAAGWRSLLETLEQDGDADVRHFAREALVSCP
eukprot:TRINITY_DN47403_c0_g1_i1.p1 TRINITY_DN47403_c0_g1~~TRINITY_DN47403_c0_g1_i1.p1  ORF type:complete len:590 (+),score=237.94 TRINITY_DN47403_c0_g1_i1:91-1860(+)